MRPRWCWRRTSCSSLKRPSKSERQRRRAIGRLLGALLGAVIVVAVIGVAFSSRGLGGTISHEWKNFTTTKASSVYAPNRLLSVNSANRWVWWKEAAGGFSARPIAGWGAGSFPVVHLLYRRDMLSVNQPHSVPLQFLAETGAIGAILAVGGFGLLLAAAIRAVRRSPAGGERLLWAALLAGAVAYAAHALYDWDWNIPGVTLPALVFLGVLAGAGRRRAIEERSAGARPGVRLSLFGPGIRLIGVATLTFGLCIFAISVVLPSLAASKASTALVEAASDSPTTVASAEADAKLAASLDPLSDAGPRVEATIAVRDGQAQHRDRGSARRGKAGAKRRSGVGAARVRLLRAARSAGRAARYQARARTRSARAGRRGCRQQHRRRAEPADDPAERLSDRAPADALVGFGPFFTRQPRAKLVDFLEQLRIFAP